MKCCMNLTVIIYIASSVDGYIARKSGAVDWLSQFESPQLEKNYKTFYDTIDIVVMGNNTYKKIKHFERFPYREKECYVFTRNNEIHEDENVIYTHENPNKFLHKLNGKKTKIWLVGGANLIKQFISKKLVDEFIITFVPILLGRGIPLFKEHIKEQTLKLVEVKSFEGSILQTHYKIEK